MYAQIVARRIRSTFERINDGNTEAMVLAMAPQFRYRFYGEHALSGERRTPEALRLWWARIFRLIPDIQFEVDEVIVQGPPWNTRAATSVEVSATLPGGIAYRNIMFQIVHIRWGRITDVQTLEDTAKLEGYLALLASIGRAEALAEPITD